MIWLSVCRVLFVLLELLFVIDTAHGGGQLSLRLLSYSHPSGQLVSSQCCDDQQLPCDPTLCDPYFLIHISEVNKVTSAFNISFQTGVTHNAEFINFTSRIGDTVNPLNSSFGHWPGAAEISVDILDDNSDRQVPDDLINSLKSTHTQSISSNNEGNYTLVAPITNNSTVIWMESNMKCDEGCHYDLFCYKCCIPMDNATGHIYCDKRGNPHCLQGWTGRPESGCLEPICTPACPSYSTCEVVHGTQTCVCKPGILSGAHCQQPMTTTRTPSTTSTTTTALSTTSMPATSMTTTTTTTTTPMTTATTTLSTAKNAHKKKDTSGGCSVLLCYIFIPVICLLALTIIGIIVTFIIHYVENRKAKAVKVTKVDPFRSLGF